MKIENAFSPDFVLKIGMLNTLNSHLIGYDRLNELMHPVGKNKS